MADFSVSAVPGDASTEREGTFVAAPPDSSAGSESLSRRIVRMLRDTSGMWAITDQAVVSVGNFTTNIFLGRVLSEEVYGTYGVLLETMFWLISLQAALVVYPMSVRGALIDDSRRLKRFATANLCLTLGMAIPLAVGLLLAGGAINKFGLSLGLCAGLALLIWHLQELFRRLLFARLRFKDAIFGDAIRYLGQAVLVISLYLYYGEDLQLAMVFLALATTAVLGSVVQAWQIGMARIPWTEIKPMLQEFWRLGRWMLAANMTFLVSTLGIQWTLAWKHDLQTFGAYAALSNIVKLSHPLMFGIVAIITPAAARASAEGGRLDARSVTVKYALQGLMVLLPFYLVLAAVPSLAVGMVYGADKYTGLESELRVYVVWYVVLYISSVLGAYLSGLERARHHFHAQLVHAVAAAAIALPLTIQFGLMGMLIGGVIAKTVLCLAFLWYLRRVG